MDYIKKASEITTTISDKKNQTDCLFQLGAAYNLIGNKICAKEILLKCFEVLCYASVNSVQCCEQIEKQNLYIKTARYANCVFY